MLKIRYLIITSLGVLLSLLISKEDTYALPYCEQLDKSELDYIIEQSSPDDLDLSCQNGTPFTDEYLNRTKIKSTVPSRRYFTNKLEVTPFLQDRNYFCGYAAVKEVIHYINGSSKSQLEYANEMGNPESSAIVYKVRNILNRYTNKGYEYILGTSISQDQFKTMIENNVANNKPTVLHALTNTLAMYNGYTARHYIVATGNTISGSYPYSVFYVDSFSKDYGAGNTFGEHLDTIENVFGSVNQTERFVIY